MMMFSLILTLSWEILIIYDISSLPSVYIGLFFTFMWVLFPKVKSYAL